MIMEPFFLCFSILLNTSCFTSSLSSTTSMIKSASLIRSKLSSMFPVVMSLAFFLCIRGAGLPNLTGLSIFLTALSAITLRLVAPSGTMSKSVTGKPALATCAAIPLPINPAPITATLLIFI